jgi:SNF2 family DNA or RNA helicase
VLVDAQVDMNPHQVEAALFAFKLPMSKGAIFADEVGLGKTIAAGLVMSQKWADATAAFWSLPPHICFGVLKQLNQGQAEVRQDRVARQFVCSCQDAHTAG